MNIWRARQPIYSGGPAPAPVPHTDTFTGSAGTALESHAPDGGGSWSKHPNYASSSAVLTVGGTLRCAVSPALYLYSVVPSSPDYDVAADVIAAGSLNKWAGPVGRCDPTASTHYRVEYDVNIDAFRIIRLVSGVQTTLATGSATLGGGTGSARVVLRLRGTLVQCLVNGVLDCQANDAAIPGPGRQGIWIRGTMTDSVGVYLDNFDNGTAILRGWAPGAVVAAQAPPEPGRGSAVSLSGQGPLIVTGPPAARPVLASQEAPRAWPGQAILDTAPIPAAVVGPATPRRAGLAAQEPPGPWPGSIIQQARPGPLQPVQAPSRSIVAAAPEGWRPDPGAVLICSPDTPFVPGPDVPIRAVQPGAEHPAHATGQGRVLQGSNRGPTVLRPATPRRATVANPEAPPAHPGRVMPGPAGDGRRPPQETFQGLSYRVYANGGSGPVNFSAPLIVTANQTWTTGTLAAGSWKFVVRAYCGTSGLEEKNLDAQVAIEIAPDGADLSQRPGAPQGLAATPGPGGSIRVEWTYPVQTGGTPLGFRVYRGTGGAPSYGAPVATVPMAAGVNQTYRATVPGGSDGVAYWFGVRAYNATGEEPNAVAVSCVADATGPGPVDDLTADAIATQGSQ